MPLNPQIRNTAKGELVGPWQTLERRSYGLAASDKPPAWQRLPPTRSDLNFAAGSNPQLEALALGWRQQLPPAERLAAAQALFQGQPFRYTLQPPALGDDAPLDQFLFGTRAGFCEHFASAFTDLMRAAGVPARVVVGYQGGSWVPASLWGRGYLEVLQQDAHAWSEVWLADQGWVRIDPTAWVAPARIRGGLRSGLAGQWADLGLLRQGLPWLRPLTRSWTNLDLAWSQLLHYDQASQDELMRRLLGPFRSWQGMVLVVGLGLALALDVGILGLLRPTPRQDQQRRQTRWRQPHGRRPELHQPGRQGLGTAGDLTRAARINPLSLQARPGTRSRCSKAKDWLSIRSLTSPHQLPGLSTTRLIAIAITPSLGVINDMGRNHNN